MTSKRRQPKPSGSRLVFIDVSRNKVAKFQAIQIGTLAELRGLSHYQEEFVNLIIPDSIFDRHTKINMISAAGTEFSTTRQDFELLRSRRQEQR